MKLKIANRFIFTDKKTILSKIIIFAGILFSLNLYGETGESIYAPDISNPFHDIFNLYFNNEKKTAINLLKKQFKSRTNKNQAYINYGLIQELEKNYAEAEKYYRMALANNERISILFLFNLYSNYDKDKMLPLLNALHKHQESYWILYEKAVHYIGSNDSDRAIETLSEAIDNGFPSADLLSNDPAFNSIRNTFKFKWLVRRAEKNRSRSRSILQEIKLAEHRFKSNKPYGISRELEEASKYEKQGKDKKALNILKSSLKTNLSFRDKSITLFWLARINAKTGNDRASREYLREFSEHISGPSNDDTGYRDLISPLYKDIISNDRNLKNIYGGAGNE